MLKDFFEKYSIASQDTLVIACSGWADSMFLLCEVMKLHPRDRIIVGHFNHRLRGPESDEDEWFVRDYCDKNSILLEVDSSNISADAQSMKMGIEETARSKRYEYLESLRKKYGARYILTAHHLDDSIETLVFNLIRGTRLTWLTGVPEQNENILRPLLALSKVEILAQLHESACEYRTDSSNLDPKYLRNHIRTNIIPEFSKINPEYRKSIAGFMGYASELQDMLDEQVERFLWWRDHFLVSEYLSLSTFLQREVVRFLYDRANNGTIWLSEGNMAEMIRFIREAEGGTEKTVKELSLKKRKWIIFFT